MVVGLDDVMFTFSPAAWSPGVPLQGALCCLKSQVAVGDLEALTVSDEEISLFLLIKGSWG